jgi:hypothetical protein
MFNALLSLVGLTPALASREDCRQELAEWMRCCKMTHSTLLSFLRALPKGACLGGDSKAFVKEMKKKLSNIEAEGANFIAIHACRNAFSLWERGELDCILKNNSELTGMVFALRVD